MHGGGGDGGDGGDGGGGGGGGAARGDGADADAGVLRNDCRHDARVVVFCFVALCRRVLLPLPRAVGECVCVCVSPAGRSTFFFFPSFFMPKKWIGHGSMAE